MKTQLPVNRIQKSESEFRAVLPGFHKSLRALLWRALLGLAGATQAQDILHQPIGPQHPLPDVRNFSQSMTWKAGAATAEFSAPLWNEDQAQMTGVGIYYRVNGGATQYSALSGGSGGYTVNLPGIGAGDSVAYFFDQVLKGQKAPIHVNTAWFGRRPGSPAPEFLTGTFAAPRTFSFAVRFRDRHEDEWRYDHYVKGYQDSTFLFVTAKDYGTRVEMTFKTLKRSYYDSFRLYDHWGITPGYDLIAKPVTEPDCERADFKGVTAIPDSTHTVIDSAGYFSYHWTVEPVTYGQQLDLEWTNNILNTSGVPQQYYSEILRYYVGQGPQPMHQHPYANAAGPLSINKVSYRRFAFNQHLNAPKPETLIEFFGGKSIFDTDWEKGDIMHVETPNGCNLSHPEGEVYLERITPASPISKAFLGPKFNNTSCNQCHFLDGRGTPDQVKGVPYLDAPYKSLLMRVSVPGTDEHGGPKPHPVYGGQLREFATDGQPGDGAASIQYEEIPSGIAGVTLRSPTYSFSGLKSDPVDGTHVLFSPRVAPQIPGLGLLEGVAEKDILDLADAEAAAGRVAGKPNRVWDAERKTMALGRFGWKAGQPNLKQQAAAAAANDIGLANPLFPAADGSIELDGTALDKLAAYLTNLAPPPRMNWQDPDAIAGKTLFENAQCGDCHAPVLKTTLRGYDLPNSTFTIQPFTDLLLHDMGPGLSDGRAEYSAGPQQWRTPPLWAVGMVRDVSLHSNYLHDGRARNLLEAILWHGGEGEKSKQAVVAMNETERKQLLAYVAYPFADVPATTPYENTSGTLAGIGYAPPLHANRQINRSVTLFAPGLGVIFQGEVADAQRILVVTPNGSQVKELPVAGERIVWDLRSDRGKPLGNGLFFLNFIGKSGRTVLSRKVALPRR